MSGFSGRRRYHLLETVRMYAREQLNDAGEASTLADRQAGWALALAEEGLGSPRFDRDAANVRVGLDTLLEMILSQTRRITNSDAIVTQ